MVVGSGFTDAEHKRHLRTLLRALAMHGGMGFGRAGMPHLNEIDLSG